MSESKSKEKQIVHDACAIVLAGGSKISEDPYKPLRVLEDIQKPMIQVYKDMVLRPTHIHDEKTLAAATMATMELIKKINLYRIGITKGDVNDLTKIYEEQE